MQIVAVNPRTWKRDVKLAVELFGKEEVARNLRVTTDAVRSWLKGVSVPSAESTIPTRLATLLDE